MSKVDLPKVYDASQVEDDIYKKWEESGFFNPDNLAGKGPTFTVSMPPPNVTGILHLGHALENSIMDIQIRYQRMLGKKALLVPGTDHAAVATQARVEDILKKSGIKNPREEFGREGLLQKIREYADQSKATILSQIKKMGTSCDWSRLAYTLDEQRSKAVNEMFRKMFEDGLIYRGYRVINWSVKGQSTCSDDELVYVDKKTMVHTFKYSQDFPIPIATTRPETKLGDTAMAVHPDDTRYKKYIGQKFIVDLGAKALQTITVIADEKVDPKYGTGAVGVTPAHSHVDFEMYQKNKAIGLIQVIGQDGQMTEEAGPAYVGLTVEEAREKFISWLKENDLYIGEEEIVHNVGTSDRFGDVVEALPMEQWFIDVNKEIPGRKKSLKDLMKEAVTIGHGGDETKKINITPDRFAKVYLGWIDNLRDWNISRQIWWGHRIPVWYKDGEVIFSIDSPGDSWQQDPDTLDTWFSSGAWTFSTLGWPDSTADMKKFHPTSWMQMGYEILFFWMARMILMSTYALNDIPFKEVYIHGMLRDSRGVKFSKSANNGIDPLAMVEKYGADALRLSLIKGVSAGNDARFYEEKVEAGRNFINKLWNVSRFILQTAEDVSLIVHQPKAKTLADSFILAKLAETIKVVSQNLEQCDFSYASEKLYDFTWDEFADWYLEIAKVEGHKDEILLFVLQNLLKLWHPFCPFITEEIWGNFNTGKLLMVEDWPTADKIETKSVGDFELIKNIITAIRTMRAENKIEPKKKIKATIYAGKRLADVEASAELIKNLRTGLEELTVAETGDKPESSLATVVDGVEIYLDLTGIIDIEAESGRLEKEIGNARDFIARLQAKLANEDFVSHAPKAVIDGEKEKLAIQEDKLAKLTEQLQNLK